MAKITRKNNRVPASPPRCWMYLADPDYVITHNNTPWKVKQNRPKNEDIYDFKQIIEVPWADCFD